MFLCGLLCRYRKHLELSILFESSDHPPYSLWVRPSIPHRLEWLPSVHASVISVCSSDSLSTSSLIGQRLCSPAWYSGWREFSHSTEDKCVSSVRNRSQCRDQNSVSVRYAFTSIYSRARIIYLSCHASAGLESTM